MDRSASDEGQRELMRGQLDRSITVVVSSKVALLTLESDIMRLRIEIGQVDMDSVLNILRPKLEESFVGAQLGVNRPGIGIELITPRAAEVSEHQNEHKREGRKTKGKTKRTKATTTTTTIPLTVPFWIVLPRMQAQTPYHASLWPPNAPEDEEAPPIRVVTLTFNIRQSTSINERGGPRLRLCLSLFRSGAYFHECKHKLPLASKFHSSEDEEAPLIRTGRYPYPQYPQKEEQGIQSASSQRLRVTAAKTWKTLDLSEKKHTQARNDNYIHSSREEELLILLVLHENSFNILRRNRHLVVPYQFSLNRRCKPSPEGKNKWNSITWAEYEEEGAGKETEGSYDYVYAHPNRVRTRTRPSSCASASQLDVEREGGVGGYGGEKAQGRGQGKKPLARVL
ncbi:hypothetical protein C8R42DRAFT_649170 [Lentinula raphanica]|nr:hypothetical protein C8R42DRAFT_649170 [Lentinula raphanica]